MIEPKGGTELQLEFLHKYVDKNLLDNFQICTSVPGKVPVDKNKINILWQKNISLHQQFPTKLQIVRIKI